MENRQITLPVGRGKVRELELIGLAIRSVLVLNNTPAYLYLGLNANPSRLDCVVQVEPYTYLCMPLEAQERLYIADGELVAPLGDNSKAVVIWGEQVREMSVARVRRTVEYTLAADKTVKQDGSGTANATTFSTLSLKPGQAAPPVGAAASYVLPGFATHRTLYAALAAGTFTKVTLDGQYNGAWHVLRDLTPATASRELSAALTDLALPESVRLTVIPSQDTTLSAVVRFDI